MSHPVFLIINSKSKEIDHETQTCKNMRQFSERIESSERLKRNC